MAYLHETAPSQVSLFFSLAEKYADDVFMCAKFKNGEPGLSWENTTWRQTAEQVRHMGAGLIARGVDPGDRLVIFSPNQPRWIISDLAVQGAGATGVPVYPAVTDSQLAFILNDCRATVLMTGDSQLLARVLHVKKDAPSLKFIVYLGAAPDGADPFVLSYDDLLAQGRNDQDARKAFETRKDRISEIDTAAILYTPGTTGDPRGVVLTQGNFKAQTRLMMNLPVTRRLLERGIRLSTLSHLPLCHITGRISDYHVQMTLGSVIYFAESMQTVQKNLLEVRPQTLASVPRLYEKMYETIFDYGARLGGIRKNVFDWGMKTGRKAADAMIRGESLSLGLVIRFALANLLVYRHIRTFAGLDRLVSATSSGGPLSPDIVRFFRAMNIVIAESHNMTETTGPIAWNGLRFIEPLPDDSIHKKALDWFVDTMVLGQGRGECPFASLKGFLKVLFFSKLVLPRMVIKPGTVGRPLDETLMKLGEDGEILVKGPQVFSLDEGYLNQEKATKDVFTDDGFFKTDDIGMFDSDGFLRITDRKKDLWIAASGNQMAPLPLELVLNQSPFIDQSCVVCNGGDALAALIVPRFDSLERYARQTKIPFDDRKDLVAHEGILNVYRNTLGAINRTLPSHEQIRAFRLLTDPFTVETGTLTPALRMKRRVIQERYGREIEALFQDAACRVDSSSGQA